MPKNILKLLQILGAALALSACLSSPVIAAPNTTSPNLPETASWQYGLPPVSSEFTDGGAGGRVIRVTNTDAMGPGSLRAALSEQGARTIVFEVGGVIDLSGDNILVEEPHVTIAGQTAPSPGITIIRGGLIIRGHDVIVQHLRIRPGDLGEAPRSGRDIDSITTIAAYNVIIDHCSLSWATDENLSASGPRFTGETESDWRAGTSHNILFSNNIIAEGLANSTHAKGEHSKGSLIHDNVSDILIYANLYASNYERSPMFKGGVRGAIVNNYIYNPGQRAIHYNLQALEWAGVTPTLGQMDVIGNVMKAGPSTAPGLPLIMIGGIGDLSLYMEDNLALNRWGVLTPVLGRYTSNAAEFVEATSPHFQWPTLHQTSTENLEAALLEQVGARAWDRDIHDVRVLADTAEGRGGIIDSQSEVGGYPVAPISQKNFVPEQWDLNTMTPIDNAVLDDRSSAKGT